MSDLEYQIGDTNHTMLDLKETLIMWLGELIRGNLKDILFKEIYFQLKDKKYVYKLEELKDES